MTEQEHFKTSQILYKIAAMFEKRANRHWHLYKTKQDKRIEKENPIPQGYLSRGDWHYDADGYCDNPTRGY